MSKNNKKYDVYKDSNVEWIGKTPVNWNLIKAKHLFSQSFDKGGAYLVLLSATQNDGVIPKDRLDGVVQVKEDADLSVFKTVKKGDFVISLRSFQGGFEYSSFDGVITPAYTVFRKKERICDDYFKKLFKSDGFIAKINSLTTGIREGKNIQYEDFANMLLPLLGIDEQQQIADYLDKKCGEIDRVIETQKDIIDKLKEYKQSVITEAVTKGLDKSIPLKNSGVEWIGKIPEHWEVCRLKNYAKIQNGQDFKSIEDDNGSIPVIGSGGEFARANECLYHGESILLGRKGTIDKPLYVNCAFWTVDTMYYTQLENITFGKYFYYLCKTINFDFYQYGSAVPSMTQRDLNSVRFPLPKKDEQRQIADYIDKRCSEIDLVISNKEQLIEKLTEYKKSLIYECVTGKRKVVA